MINAPQLLADLTRRLTVLEADLRERINTVQDLKASLQSEWQAARDAERTAETFESWVDQVITQAGVHWLLSCVFLRFIEDNEMVDRPWIGGTPDSGRLNLARDRHEAYFRAHPLETDREYLLACFREAGSLPGLHTFFDEAHNPVFRLGVSGDAAMALRSFWQQQDPNTGALLHDFTDATWNTRFLGDLYQDLSEATRKRYALLQTPEFVEEFILDRTLTPAIREFGYREVRMIDPTCGSGHFLLGGFQRMVDEWSRAEPARNRRDVAQKALDAVAGVDLNPFAVAISRFRLLVAALKASDVHRLSEAPDFKIHVAIGDSLLHGKRSGPSATNDMFQHADHFADTGLAHAYASEDLTEVQRILDRQYHAVVGNPPYIVVKDAALNAAYRKQYASCHMKYSLGAPFTERFFELARRPASADFSGAAGFVGLITANSFMKREFGSKLIEQVLPRLDLTHVVDTSGAYIPGHGTPTVILFGRHRLPVGDEVRTVMGIKGEPTAPDDPAQGLVWRSIVDQVDVAGSESAFVSVADTPRTTFARHPWSIGGGGAADLKEMIEEGCRVLKEITVDIGVASVTGEDDLYILDTAAIVKRLNVEISRPLVTGDLVRDWYASSQPAVWLYDEDFSLLPIDSLPSTSQLFWSYRSLINKRKRFGTPMVERGLTWYEWQELYVAKLRTPLTITFAFVATHNHFVLDRGGRVFKNSAPVIKLPPGASEAEHLGLLGLLNSSAACFWMKQVCSAKHIGDPAFQRFEYDGTKMSQFPVIESLPIDLACTIDRLAQERATCAPSALFSVGAMSRISIDATRARSVSLRGQMIAAQEEVDWRCYRLYGLLPANSEASAFEHPTPPEVALGERAFEIVLARRMAAGTEQSAWFERHGSTPITDIPCHWPEDYRRVVQRRIDLIASNRNIGLIERPEYKRRWNSPQWEVLEQAALKSWLLDRMEAASKVGAGDTASLTSANKLADQMRADADFMQVAALYAGHADFDPAQLVAELVVSEAVPFLRVLRYTDTGLRKRTQWEDTWALQRREDAGEAVGKIPVPPKYQSKDFLKTDVWRLRGGLDVPKERWVSYPGCERGVDGSLVIAWAGWNHLQQATAIAAYYLDMKDNEGWPPERLQPLLAGIQELVPWLQQWHNDLDPTYGERMGDYYKGFVAEEARALGFTLDDLRAWKPAVTAARRGRRTAA